MNNCVLCLPQFALGEGTTKAEPSTVKGNFLLFDKGVIPQSQVTVYSAFVRTPAEYNNIHELEKIVKPMMNVKVGKEHGVFCAVADDPGKGVLIGLVYFHERVRPLLATDVAITKISWADVDYELPDRELVEGLHPALLGAANAMDEWVEEVPLTRKEKEVRAQARAQAATTSADEAAKAAAEAAGAASIEASKNAKAKAAEERAAAAKAAAELAARNAPTNPGPLASWDVVEKLKKMALVNELKFHKVKFGEHENRPQLVIMLCAKLNIKKEAARVESKKSSRKRESLRGSSSGKQADGGKIGDDDDELADDPEIALEKARIEKATKRLKVLAELRKQADELERSAAAAGPAPSGAAAGPAPSGASTAVVAGATGVSPGKAIANGDQPYRDLARGATHIYERGAFDGATVNISGASSDLSAMMGGGSAFMRQSSRPDYATPSPMLTASSSSSGSMGPYVGHTHDAHIAAAAASMRRQQQERAHHGQQQQQQHQWPQQTHWPQQPPPPPPPPPGPCGFY